MVLAAAAAVILLWFIAIAQERLLPEDFARIRPRLYGALAGDLAAPVVAWFALKAIGRRRARKAQEAA